MKKYTWLVGCIAIAVILFSACQKSEKKYTRPVYPNATFPSLVTVSFPKQEKDKKLPDLAFHIDNQKMRIWNKEPLPYESKYDSIDIKIAVTSEATVKILNEQTNKVVTYTATRDKERIEAKGGKLKVRIELEGSPTLVYDLRLLTYGYNPNKYTWEKENIETPVAATDARYFEFQGLGYWLAALADGSSKLYRFDYHDLSFTDLSEYVLPERALTNSLYIDRSNTAWLIAQDGKLFKSIGLDRWEQHNTDGVILTNVIGETTLIDGEKVFIAVGHPSDSDTYYDYYITSEGINRGNELPLEFPVKDAYVHKYKQAETISVTVFSGITKDGVPATRSFFLSGAKRWGETPYQDKSKLTMKGGLFLRTANPSELFVVGGIYPDGKAYSTIMRSNDKGISWAKLPEQNIPDGTFSPRHHASGLAVGTGATLQLFILGGVIESTPSQEIWHSFLDTTGGIINSYE